MGGDSDIFFQSILVPVKTQPASDTSETRQAAIWAHLTLAWYRVRPRDRAKFASGEISLPSMSAS
jgi:hypothetical protein